MWCILKLLASATVEGKLEITSDESPNRKLKSNFSFVEFESHADLKTAVEKLDGRELKGSQVTCVADVRYPCPHINLHPSHSF
jgi:hypothetical protein